jgi:nucleoside recognition membrane protein YjiH
MTNAVGKQSPGGFLYYMKLMIDMVKGHCARPSMSKVLYRDCFPTAFVIFLFSAFAAPALSRSCLLQIFVALSK